MFFCFFSYFYRKNFPWIFEDRKNFLIDFVRYQLVFVLFYTKKFNFSIFFQANMITVWQASVITMNRLCGFYFCLDGPFRQFKWNLMDIFWFKLHISIDYNVQDSQHHSSVMMVVNVLTNLINRVVIVGNWKISHS